MFGVVVWRRPPTSVRVGQNLAQLGTALAESWQCSSDSAHSADDSAKTNKQSKRGANYIKREAAEEAPRRRGTRAPIAPDGARRPSEQSPTRRGHRHSAPRKNGRRHRHAPAREETCSGEQAALANGPLYGYCSDEAVLSASSRGPPRVEGACLAHVSEGRG